MGLVVSFWREIFKRGEQLVDHITVRGAKTGGFDVDWRLLVPVGAPWENTDPACLLRHLVSIVTPCVVLMAVMGGVLLRRVDIDLATM